MELHEDFIVRAVVSRQGCSQPMLTQGDPMAILTLFPFSSLLPEALQWLNPKRNRRPRKPVDYHSYQPLRILSMAEKGKIVSLAYIVQQNHERKMICHQKFGTGVKDFKLTSKVKRCDSARSYNIQCLGFLEAVSTSSTCNC